AERITGDLPQRKRFRLMEQFKNGKIKILVATDVASRGIHVEDISHVINYDLPQDSENYVHRIGRTARAGKTGNAFALACEDYVYHLEPLEEMLGYKIPVVWPGNDWFVADKSKPIARERRSRIRKSGRKRSQHRAKRGTQTPKTPAKAKARSFPGAFFGFGPQPAKDAAAQKSEDSEKSPAKKRPRRKKKSAPRTAKKSKPAKSAKKS
ncbi:MAG: helicase-related protein, partial [Desulfobacterales bacterium]|nr:helicase-related protein [Desulfobacterales bacterium]